MKLTQTIGSTTYTSNGKWYKKRYSYKIRKGTENYRGIKRFIMLEKKYPPFILVGFKKVYLKDYYETNSIVYYPKEYNDKGFYTKVINKHKYLGFIEKNCRTKRGGCKIRVWQELPVC